MSVICSEALSLTCCAVDSCDRAHRPVQASICFSSHTVTSVNETEILFLPLSFTLLTFFHPHLDLPSLPPLQRSAAPLLHRNNESCLRLVFLFHSVFFHTVLLPHAKCPSSVQTGKTVIITSWSLSVIILRQKQQWWRVLFWKPQGLSSPANKDGHFTWGRRLGQSPKKPFRQSKWKCERVQIVWQPTRFLHNPRKMWACPFVSVGAVYMLWGQV